MVGVRWSLGSTAAGLQLRKKCSSERGPSKSERGRANQRVSRVADGEAELTEATNGAWARRRTQNKRRSSVSSSGAIWSRAQSEREGREGSTEGASERGEVGEQGVGLKRGKDVWRWPEIARSWARPRWGNVGGGLGTS
jgi:hypothetical protein